jgi:hypothetical protein
VSNQANCKHIVDEEETKIIKRYLGQKLKEQFIVLKMEKSENRLISYLSPKISLFIQSKHHVTIGIQSP